MRYSLWKGVRRIWEQNPLAPMLAALCFVVAVLCVLLSTLFGVSPISDWLLYAAELFLIMMAVVFTAHIAFGVIRDALDT